MSSSQFAKDANKSTALKIIPEKNCMQEFTQSLTLEDMHFYQEINNKIDTLKQHIQQHPLSIDATFALCACLKARALFLIGKKEKKLAMQDLEESITYNDSDLEVLDQIIGLMPSVVLPKQRHLLYYFQKRSFVLLEKNKIDESFADFTKIAQGYHSERRLSLPYILQYQAKSSEKITDSQRVQLIQQATLRFSPPLSSANTPKPKTPIDELLEWKESDFIPANAEKINDLLAKILLDDERLTHVDTLISVGIFSKLFSQELLNDLTVKDFISRAKRLSDIYAYFCICLAIPASQLDMSVTTMMKTPDSKEKYDAVSAHLDVIYLKAHKLRGINPFFSHAISDGNSFLEGAILAQNLHPLTRPWREMEYHLSQIYDESVQIYSGGKIKALMFEFYKKQLGNPADDPMRGMALNFFTSQNASSAFFGAAPINPMVTPPSEVSRTEVNSNDGYLSPLSTSQK